VQRLVPTIVPSGPVRGQTPGLSARDMHCRGPGVLVRAGAARTCPAGPSRLEETRRGLAHDE